MPISKATLRGCAQLILGLFLLVLSLSPYRTAQAHPQSGNTSAAGTYFVSPNGADNNPGTLEKPWKTVQKAANTLQPGETVLIRGGTYRERVMPKRSGGPGQEITFAAYPGETPVIDGSGISLPNTLAGLFQIDTLSYIHIKGIQVINAGPNVEDTAILVQYSSYVTIDNVHTAGSASSGILVWDSSHITITGSKIENANRLKMHECLSIGKTSDFLVANNEVTSCQMEGIDVKDGSSNGVVKRNHVHAVNQTGIYVDAWNKYTHDITLDGNLVHDNANQGIELASEQGGLLSNVLVTNNIVFHNRYVGLMVSNNQAGETLQNIQVLNNTLANNGWNDWGGGIWIDNPSINSMLIRNNILSQNVSFQIEVSLTVPSANVIIDHNLVDGYRGKTGEGETLGLNAVNGDPKFGGASIGNYHITPGSPAIQAGYKTGAPALDFDGEARGTSAVDLGADEYHDYPNKTYLPTLIRE